MSSPPGLPPHLAEAYQRLTRGIAQILPADGLADKLAEADRERRPLRVKLGIDPSRPDLHLGFAVVLRKLRQFQDLGHVAVLIIGDVTGQVGDPTDRSATRTMLSAAQTARNSASYFEQAGTILDLDPARCEIRRNSEWLAGMSMADVLRYAQHLTVAGLLERDDFAKRYAAGRSISLVEFLYPMLQGIDSVEVRADIELGGTDQTYNNLVGRTLQRAAGQPPQVVLTLPLLEGLDGVQKMSKSLGNYVGITEPPAEQFGKLMSIPDALIGRYAVLCTELAPAELSAVEAGAAAGGPQAADAKRRVARAVVALYHGTDAAKRAEASFDEVFRRREVPSDVPDVRLPGDDVVHLPALLRDAGLVASTSEARRAVRDGAVRLDGAPVEVLDVPRAELVGRVLQVGRRRAARLVG